MNHELPDDIVQEAIDTLKSGDLDLVINLLEAGALSRSLQPHLAALLSGDASQDYRVEVKVRKGIKPKHASGFLAREYRKSQSVGKMIAYQIHLFNIPRAKAVHNATKHYRLGTEMARRHYLNYMERIKFHHDKSEFLKRSFEEDYKDLPFIKDDFVNFVSKKPLF